MVIEGEMISLGFDLDDAYWAFRNVQAWEAWQSLGPWITDNKPDLGPGVRERFEYGRELPRDAYEKACGRSMPATGPCRWYHAARRAVFPSLRPC